MGVRLAGALRPTRLTLDAARTKDILIMRAQWLDGKL
jgi:hypothetical protein